MEIDQEKIDEAVLALMYLSLDEGTRRAWKGMDWDAMDRLRETELRGSLAGSATLAELATHTSSLPSVPDDLPQGPNPYAGYNWDRLLAALMRAKPDPTLSRPYPPSYSNMGFALLGHILSQVDRRSFAEVIAARISRPLELRDTAFELSTDQRSRFLDGHGMDLAVVSHWDMEAFAPTGALKSTATDMLKFVQANLHPDLSTPLGRVIALSQSNVWGWDDSFFKLGVHYKNGGTGGFRSGLLIDPKRSFGVVVLTDFADQVDTLMIPLVNPSIADLKPFPVSGAELAGCTGTFVHPSSPPDQLEISMPGHFLVADLQDLGRARLQAVSPSEFLILDNIGAMIVRSGRILFERDVHGSVTGLKLLLKVNGTDQEIRFERKSG